MKTPNERTPRHYSSLGEKARQAKEKMQQLLGLYWMPAAVSSVALRDQKVVGLPLRSQGLRVWKPAALAIALLAFSCVAGQAAVNVSLGPKVPVSLQEEFLRDATSHYQGTLTKSAYFPNTYTFVITGKKAPEPPATGALLTGTAFSECSAASFGDGLDCERYEGVKIIYQKQAADFRDKTCGGYEISASTTSCFNSCIAAYDRIVEAVQERWGYIYGPMGEIIAP